MLQQNLDLDLYYIEQIPYAQLLWYLLSLSSIIMISAVTILNYYDICCHFYSDIAANDEEPQCILLF